LHACARDDFPAAIAVVISNRPSAPALKIARRHGAATRAMPQSVYGGDAAARDRAMLGVLHEVRSGRGGAAAPDSASRS